MYGFRRDKLLESSRSPFIASYIPWFPHEKKKNYYFLSCVFSKFEFLKSYHKENVWIAIDLKASLYPDHLLGALWILVLYDRG